MNTTEAIKVLTEFNHWRRGADMPQPDPKVIGQAIDKAIEVLQNGNDNAEIELDETKI